MNEALLLLKHDGYKLLFAWVFAEQFGIPLPAAPALLAAGTLAGLGHLNWAADISIAATASLLADGMWFVFGRARGAQVARFCVRLAPSTGAFFHANESSSARLGGGSIIVGKFIPGIAWIVPPLSGACGMATWRFLVFDGIASLVWTGSLVGTGYLFGSEFGSLAELSSVAGVWELRFVVVNVVGWAAYLIFKRLWITQPNGGMWPGLNVWTNNKQEASGDVA